MLASNSGNSTNIHSSCVPPGQRNHQARALKLSACPWRRTWHASWSSQGCCGLHSELRRRGIDSQSLLANRSGLRLDGGKQLKIGTLLPTILNDRLCAPTRVPLRFGCKAGFRRIRGWTRRPRMEQGNKWRQGRTARESFS